MDGRRVLFDVAAYILFEACGDSEIECFDRTISGAFEVESDAGVAEDDAQSCSYEESSSVSSREHEVDAVDGDYLLVGLGVGECLSGEDEHRVDEEFALADSDEEDGVVDQYCGRCTAAKKSNGIEDWTMSEQERGRLFWENCLAS